MSNIKKLTGVGGHFSAAHIDKDTKILHGHTWEVIAWFNSGKNAIRLLDDLNNVLQNYDHACLPENLSWSENIAEEICNALDDCVEVTISRPLERIYAKSYKVGL